jgi:hypothetical protein
VLRAPAKPAAALDPLTRTPRLAVMPFRTPMSAAGCHLYFARRVTFLSCADMLTNPRALTLQISTLCADNPGLTALAATYREQLPRQPSAARFPASAVRSTCVVSNMTFQGSCQLGEQISNPDHSVFGFSTPAFGSG